MTGPAAYSRDADVAATARELLDVAAEAVSAVSAAQRAAIATLLELWPTSAWRAAGCVSATSWLMAYAGLSYPEAQRLEKITELCSLDERLAEAVVSGGLSMGRAWVLARAVTEERARFLTGGLVERLLGINAQHPDDDDRWTAALAWWRELVDQQLGPARAQRHSLVATPSLFGGGEIHAHLLPTAFANVLAGLDAFTQDPDPKDAPYQRTHSERRADALDDMAAFAITHHCDDDDACPDAQDEADRAEDTFDGLDGEWDDLDEAETLSEELSEEQLEDLDLLELFRRRLRRKIADNRRRASRRIRARSGTRATIHIDLRTMAALRDIDDLEDLILRGEGFGVVYRTAEEMLCDSVLVATLFSRTGQVLDTTDDTERWTKRQRRAIAARDHHCVFPGCTRPPKHCDIHHLHPLADGGPTTIANGALLCRFHHRLLHHHRWQLSRDDNGTWTATDPHGTQWNGRRTTQPAAA